jgi:hypothetical protein
VTIEQVAKIAHEVNRAYCSSLGDDTQPRWEDAPAWQKASIMSGIQFIQNHPDAGPEFQHNCWMEGKLADGWKFGKKKDPERKEHPCLVKFAELSRDQQIKDTLFTALVKASPLEAQNFYSMPHKPSGPSGPGLA